MNKRILVYILAFCAIVTFASFGATDKPQADLTGTWLGTLDVSGFKLRIVFHFKKSDEGKLLGTMDSPDQGAYNLPVDTVKVDSNKVHLAAISLAMTVDGKLSQNDSVMTCDFVQSGTTLPLTLERTDQVPIVSRPQNPVQPYPYDTAAVKFENQEAGITLAGTLTMPKSQPPHPAVILITGSGPQDRDETIFGHKPFWVIADYLSRQGVAVLRYDDRGYAGSTGNFASATSEDFAGDVRAAIAFLQKNSDIDPNQIGLIGHSEGALIAPMVAAQNKDVAFIVLLAAPGVVGEEILYEQAALMNKANGINDSLISWNRNFQKEFFRILKSEPDSVKAKAMIKEMAHKKLDELNDAEKQTLGLTEQELDSQINSFTSNWFRKFLTYDPIPALQRVACPILVLYGELDLQTPPEQNAKVIEQALKESGNKDFTVKVLPSLNHLFQTAATGSPKVYGIITETFAPVALETMSSWILERVH